MERHINFMFCNKHPPRHRIVKAGKILPPPPPKTSFKHKIVAWNSPKPQTPPLQIPFKHTKIVGFWRQGIHTLQPVWFLTTVRVSRDCLPRISLTVPASVLAILRARMVRAILMMSSRARLPLCFTETQTTPTCRGIAHVFLLLLFPSPRHDLHGWLGVRNQLSIFFSSWICSTKIWQSTRIYTYIHSGAVCSKLWILISMSCLGSHVQAGVSMRQTW